MKIRLFEAFAGYGSQSLALKKYGIEYEHVGICEIDKYAIKAHKALHGNVRNYGDISLLEPIDIPDMDMFTYSFPCQDISIAGAGNGLIENSGTRSSLLWECKKVIKGKRPRILMLENVKNLVGKNNKPHFDMWLEWLEEQGYNNYWQVLNAKWCGVPQHRERVFVVSIHKDYDDGSFTFNAEYGLENKINHILQTDVERKYYLSNERYESLLSMYIQSGESLRPFIKEVVDGIEICQATRKGYDLAGVGDVVNIEFPRSKTRRGRVGRGISKTITTSSCQYVVEKNVFDNQSKYKLRQLTPFESFRLMGLSADEILKIQATGVSNPQQYKLAGNSIVVDQMAFVKNIAWI